MNINPAKVDRKGKVKIIKGDKPKKKNEKLKQEPKTKETSRRTKIIKAVKDVRKVIYGFNTQYLIKKNIKEYQDEDYKNTIKSYKKRVKVLFNSIFDKISLSNMKYLNKSLLTYNDYKILLEYIKYKKGLAPENYSFTDMKFYYNIMTIADYKIFRNYKQFNIYKGWEKFSLSDEKRNIKKVVQNIRYDNNNDYQTTPEGFEQMRNDYINMILFIIKGLRKQKKQFLIKISLYDVEMKTRELQTINKCSTKSTEFIKRLETVENGTFGEIYGSDAEIWASSDVDYKTFHIAIFNTKKGGCQNDSKFKKYNGEFLIATCPKSTNNNCLIEIFRLHNKELGTSNNLRKLLNLNKDMLNTYEDLPKLILKFGITADIYEDRLNDKGEIFQLYKSKEKMRNHINILLKDNHYYEIINFKDTKPKPKPKPEPKPKLKQEPEPEPKKKKVIKERVFFDYETITDENGKLHPYYLQVRHNNKNYEFHDDKFKKEDSKINIRFLDLIMKINHETNNPIILIGYNSSRFDNFLILDSLLSCERTPNLLYVNNSILKLDTNILSVFDLCRFTSSSLSDACESFKLKNKKVEGFNHAIPQKEYNNNRFDKWFNDNIKEIANYALYDVLSLEELFNKVRDSIFKICNEDILKHSTISGASFKIWMKLIREPEKIDPNKKIRKTTKPAKNEKIKYKSIYTVKNEIIKDNHGNENKLYNFIRGSLTAGRSQMFRKNYHHKGNISVIDITSLYPFVMSGGNEKYKCEYPNIYETPIYTDEYIKNKIGFYYVDILKQPKKNIIPYRTKEAPLNWEYDKPIYNISLCSVDIESLLEHKADIKIYNGIYWENSTDKIFKSYMDLFKKEKMRQDKLKDSKNKDYNPAIRAVCKLFSNSLSGKVIEGLHTEQYILSNKADNIEEFINSNEITDYIPYEINNYVLLKGTKYDKNEYYENNKKPHYLGVLLYAYARKYMYNSVISEYIGFGMDTDSYFMPEDEYLRLRKDKPHLFGDEYGLFKVENFEEGKIKIWDDCYFIAPKLYGLFSSTDEEHNKTRFKGLKMNDRIFKDVEEANKFNSLDNNEKLNKYESLNKVSKTINKNTFIIKDVYNKLVNNDNIYSLSSLLLKRNLELKSSYIVKMIKPHNKEELNYKPMKSDEYEKFNPFESDSDDENNIIDWDLIDKDDEKELILPDYISDTDDDEDEI